jgi:Fe-S-cluster-containing dehydrogenase component
MMVERDRKLPDEERREFLRSAGKALVGAGALLGGAAGAADALLGASAEAAAPTAAPSPVRGHDWNAHRWGYGIDTNKCIGCLRCVQACKRENGIPLDAHHFRTWVERYVIFEGEHGARIDSHSDPHNIAAGAAPGDYRFDNRYFEAEGKIEKAFFVPKICNHCAKPSCVKVCPVGATFRTPDGVVLIDHKYCIGCGYCVQACPYGARYINHDLGVSDKCTWCYHRITKGLKPACVDACPTGARVFGDLNETASDIREFIRTHRVEVLHPETGNAPQVVYAGLDQEVA